MYGQELQYWISKHGAVFTEVNIRRLMMTSSSWKKMRITGPLCVGNSPVTGEFPSQRPVTWSFDVFFDLHLNTRLSKRSWGWWFERPSCSLWRHFNGFFFSGVEAEDSIWRRDFRSSTEGYWVLHQHKRLPLVVLEEPRRLGSGAEEVPEWYPGMGQGRREHRVSRHDELELLWWPLAVLYCTCIRASWVFAMYLYCQK